MSRSGFDALDSREYAVAHTALIGEALQASDHAVFVSDDRHRRYLAVNDAACALLGYRREELLALRVGEVSARSPDDLAAAYAQLRAHGFVRAVAPLRRADGVTIRIGYVGGYTSLGGGGYLLSITDPIGTAEVLASATRGAQEIGTESAVLGVQARHQGRRTEELFEAQRLQLTRRALAMREEDAVTRLTDCVSELLAVHGLSDEQILGRVMWVIAQERGDSPPD